MSTKPGELHIPRLVLPCLLLGLLTLAWWNRFIQDDAFISFRYAEHLATGQGLVWFPGDRIEGYTNFLWTLLMAIPMLLGWEPILFAQLLGMLCFAGSLLLTYRLALDLLGSEPLALVALLLLGTNYTFSAYATGGLETQLQAFLVCAILFLSHRLLQDSNWSVGRLGFLSLVYALALMTRLDSALFVVVSGLFLVWSLVRQAVPLRAKVYRLLALALPSLILVGGWLFWKMIYYGNILPNTFYAKAQAGLTSPIQGLKYFQLFLTSYLLIFLLVLPIVYRSRLRSLFRREMSLIGVSLLVWFLYVVRVGGDFMEFRFFVPALPVLFILLTWLIFQVVPVPAFSYTAAGLVLVGSILHSQQFSYNRVDGVEGIADLEAHIESPIQDWDEIGRTLHSYFGSESGVVLATTAAGAIPYFSKLETVDMLGLNDAWIARHGLFLSNRPGHQRIAP